MKSKFYILFLFSYFIFATGFSQVHIINQMGLTFSPDSLNVQVGDTVRWVWSGGTHTTTSGIIPSGAAMWDSPLTQSDPEFEYIITQPGTYNYHCTPHLSMGMTGVFVAFPVTEIRNQKDFEDIKVIINSSSNTVAFNTNSTLTYQIDIFDITGSHLLLIPVYSDFKEIPIVNFNSGLYIVRFSSQSHQTKTIKFMKS